MRWSADLPAPVFVVVRSLWLRNQDGASHVSSSTFAGRESGLEMEGIAGARTDHRIIWVPCGRLSL
jgi:hypothetical protein